MDGHGQRRREEGRNEVIGSVGAEGALEDEEDT